MHRGTNWVQQSIMECLTVRLEALVKDSPDNSPFILKQKVHVKLSGGGTNIGKHLHVMNITFTILEKDKKARSWDGRHMVVIIKGEEKIRKLWKITLAP